MTFHRPSIAGAAAALLLAGLLPMQGAQAVETLKNKPWIVAGNRVSPATQQALGLVTVGGNCSGTLINRFWVLTADHCVTQNGRVGGPPLAFEFLPITAAWSTRTVSPTRYVRYSSSDSVDVALVFLGAGDFGPAGIQTLHVGPIDDGQPVVKYGRGISAYARFSSSVPPTPIPAVQDGLYRTAQFSVSQSGSTSYTLPVNTAGQVGDGGDSGGPDLLMSSNGIAVGIAGVQSSCHFTACLPGQSCTNPAGNPNWQWVTAIDSCSSAPIFNVRDRIIQAAEEGQIPCRGVSAGCAVPEVTSLLLH